MTSGLKELSSLPLSGSVSDKPIFILMSALVMVSIHQKATFCRVPVCCWAVLVLPLAAPWRCFHEMFFSDFSLSLTAFVQIAYQHPVTFL